MPLGSARRGRPKGVPHAARPGEVVEREALRVRACTLRGRQRCDCQRLSLADPRDGAGGGVDRLLRQHVCAHLRVALAFRERGVEMAFEIVQVADATALGQQQPRPVAGRGGAQLREYASRPAM
jgi:hypothetical protein